MNRARIFCLVVIAVSCSALVLPVAGEQPVGATVAGQVQGLEGGGPVTVLLQGPRTYRTVSNSEGSWEIHGVRPGTYTVRPHAARYHFDPAAQCVKVAAAGRTEVAGSASGLSPRRHTVRGKVEGLGLGERVAIVMTGARTYRTMTSADGEWQLDGVRPGSYLVRAHSARHVFNPGELAVRVSGTNQQTLVFVAE